MTSVAAGRLSGRPGASREPLTRGRRLVLTMTVAVFIIHTIGLVGAILALNALNGQLCDLRAELREGIGGVRTDTSNLRDPAGR